MKKKRLKLAVLVTFFVQVLRCFRAVMFMQLR